MTVRLLEEVAQKKEMQFENLLILNIFMYLL